MAGIGWVRPAVAAGLLSLAAGWAGAQEAARWQAEAARVTVVRDDWGIAHVHGKSDADAVFGMIYAQCEDDFPRVETNFLNSLGRLAEAEGESAVWSDLRQRLFIDPEQLKQEYAASPAWLRAIMDAWADGVNFYLLRHPEVKPRVLTRWEPWMALSFTEGSIGGDIERVDLKQLEAFYTGKSTQPVAIRKLAPAARLAMPEVAPEWNGPEPDEPEPGGSNGFAIAPSNTAAHHALLLINPHTSFFFRSELQMTSDAGLNAYGAVTWGQPFVYQGFNDRAGWMHTSSNVDAVDEYIEHVTDANSVFVARYGAESRPVVTKAITLMVRVGGALQPRTINARYTTHGPVVRTDASGNWVSIQLMQRHVAALEQSYLRTKARSFAEYSKTMELQANSSNNTIYADADGTIAYWHGNFIPRRDPRFDYTKPVDGSDPATDWRGLMGLSDTPQLKNPASGYLFNVNDSPWNGAGPSSLRQADFPAYVEQGIESARGLHAARVLAPGGVARKDFTIESLRGAAYDSFLPWFARTLPVLFTAYDGLPTSDRRRAELADKIKLLRGWDDRWAVDSKATTLAVFCGTELMWQAGAPARELKMPSEEYVATKLPGDALLSSLAAAAAKLTSDFGSWQVAWSEVNRFERLTGDIVQPFTDSGVSLPVPFVSSLWGSLASFGAHAYPGTKRWYGTGGNSFVAVVEFGPRVHAVAVTAGGESGHPQSKHFDDEATRYAAGDLRAVYFYPDQLKAHTERSYHPGETLP